MTAAVGVIGIERTIVVLVVNIAAHQESQNAADESVRGPVLFRTEPRCGNQPGNAIGREWHPLVVVLVFIAQHCRDGKCRRRMPGRERASTTPESKPAMAGSLKIER